MGYRSDGSLADLFDVSTVDRMADRITERVGDYMHERVQHHTPVSEPPPGVGLGEWVEARGGRDPGHLKRSWRKGPVKTEVGAAGEKRTIEVYTRDPVAPHVEWPTRPHLIHARRASVLRFWDLAGGAVFARYVEHPGTQGSFMMTQTLAETEGAWQIVARQALDEVAREERSR